MHIAIEGMDAVGKTTIAKGLAGKLGMKYYSKSLHAMRDSSGVYDSFITVKQLSFGQAPESSFGFRGSFLLGRVQGEDIVSDRFLTSNFWAHTHGKHFDELRYLIELAGEPDLTVILYARPDIVKDRMVKRNPHDKDLDKLPYFEEAYQCMHWFAERLGLAYLWFDTSDLTILQVIDELSTYITKYRQGSVSLPASNASLTFQRLHGDSTAILWERTVFKSCENKGRQSECLIIPDGVQELRPFSLAACDKIKEVTLPSSLRYVSALSFAGADSLEQISVSPKNPYLTSNHGVLYNKSRTKLIKFPPKNSTVSVFFEGITTVDNLAFQNCAALMSASFQTKTVLGFGAFLGCSRLSHIDLTNAEVIGQCAFLKTNRNLSILTDTSSRYRVIDGCLMDNQNHSIVFVSPHSQTHAIEVDAQQFGPWAFAYYPFNGAMEISNRVRRIGPYCFAYSNIDSVTLPESVISIDDDIFLGCSNVDFLKICSTSPPSLSSLSFNGDCLNAIIVPLNYKKKYLNIPYWDKFFDLIREQ